MIRFEDGTERDKLFDMWRRIFHDSTAYTDFYYNEVYGKNEILLEENEEALRGMLHLNPYTLRVGGNPVEAHYIVGVSTEEEYRRQGVMRNLLNAAFKHLREKGEAFTYLMPADENYYLPFSFRFGMEQHEQEVEAGITQPIELGYEFLRDSLAEPAEFVKAENDFKKSNYSICTEIDKAYLERLSKEVGSEFGIIFYVKKDQHPMGRFVVYAEDDFMSISQMVCYKKELRQEFLQQMLQFLDARYHFRQYKITYPEDWKENLLVSKEFGNLQVFRTRSYPVIMFRILDLEAMAPYMKVKGPVDCILSVEDKDIDVVNGTYHFLGDEKGLIIKKEDHSRVDGRIDIGQMTERIFGNLQKDMPEDLKDKAADFWKSIISLSPIEISEIV